MEDRVERLINLYIRNGSKGYLNLRQMSLNKLPDILKNVNVGGSFNCSVNNLTSLENAPKSVDGDFYSSANQLTSLVGAPKSVGGDFYCSYNLLTSLEGAPETVGGDFIPSAFFNASFKLVCIIICFDKYREGALTPHSLLPIKDMTRLIQTTVRLIR